MVAHQASINIHVVNYIVPNFTWYFLKDLSFLSFAITSFILSLVSACSVCVACACHVQNEALFHTQLDIPINAHHHSSMLYRPNIMNTSQNIHWSRQLVRKEPYSELYSDIQNLSCHSTDITLGLTLLSYMANRDEGSRSS